MTLKWIEILPMLRQHLHRDAIRELFIAIYGDYAQITSYSYTSILNIAGLKLVRVVT